MSLLLPDYRVSQGQVGLSADLPVRTNDFDYVAEGRVHPHDHGYFEITILHGGTALHRTAASARPVGRGTVIIIPPGPVHGFDRVHGMAGTNLYYLAEWLLDDLRLLRREEGLVPLFLAAALFHHDAAHQAPQFDLDEETYAACVAELRAIARASEGPSPSLILLKSCLLKLMVYISRAARGQVDTPGMPSFRPEVWWAIDRIEEATLRGDPFHAADAARELGMTADHLGRLFKEATGRTLVSYYKHRRVQYAQRLLLGPRMSITDVALTAGYCDAAHFCKQFKQLTGITPTAYRARYLGPP